MLGLTTLFWNDAHSLSTQLPGVRTEQHTQEVGGNENRKFTFKEHSSWEVKQTVFSNYTHNTFYIHMLLPKMLSK
jgi:hypothetical protein